MFTQLKPLIDVRPITLTLAPVAEGRIRICVVPQSLEKDKAANEKIGYKSEVAEIPKSAISALTMPLLLTGTPEELDADLPRLLTNFVEKHLQLQQAFDQASSEIVQAVEAIKERDKNKQKAKKSATAKQNGKDDDDDDDEKDDTSAKANKSAAIEKPEELPLFLCQPATNPTAGDTTNPTSNMAGNTAPAEKVGN